MITAPTISVPTIFVTILLAILVFVLPRKYFLVPIVVTACFVPADQHLAILGLHFYVNRILIVVGIVRVFVRNEVRPIRWNRLDKLVLVWALVGAGIYILRQAGLQGVIYKSGVLVDILGLYWLARQGLRSWDDLERVVGAFALCTILLAPFVAFEWATGLNPFRPFGAMMTKMREGDFRCMASFRHPIIAGAFLACLVPFFVSRAMASRQRVLYWWAVASAIFIVVASHSSTPIGGLLLIIPLVGVYSYRRYGRYMALGFFGSLLALHLVMKAPVWSLMGRITIVQGSTGWHRVRLIDGAIHHFRDWALFGTDSTANWGYYLFDVTNHFILEGVRGGLLTLIFFLIVLFVAVRTAGGYSQCRVPRDQQWLSWAICVSLVGHCVMFLGLGYFGQIEILLYMTFAFAGFIYEQQALLPAAKTAQPAGAVPRRRALKARMGVIG
jgi:hypothetical protein